jgi:hypothetical protein
MEQLKLGDLMDFVGTLLQQGMSMAKVRALPIYIGDDDELNGIHCAWYMNVVDANNDDENTQYVVEMINEDRGNFEITGKAILIS